MLDVTKIAIWCIILPIAASIRCFECDDIPAPNLCKRVVSCPANNICHLQQYVTSGGHVLFRSGCLSMQRCQSQSSLLIGRRGRPDDILVCDECCTKPYCNKEGCRTIDVPRPQRGPYCYNCPTTLDPALCEHVIPCDIGKLCVTKLDDTFSSLSQRVYIQQCEIKHASTSTVQTCLPQYCNDDFCNTNFTCVSPATNPPTIKPTVTTTVTPSTTPQSPVTMTSPVLIFNPELEAACKRHVFGGFFFDHVTGKCIQITVASRDITQNEAEVACAANQAELLSVSNEHVQDYILKQIFVNKWNDTNFWIGAVKDIQHPHFHWPGYQYMTYDHWGGVMAGQPDSPMKPNEDCVYLSYVDNYFWHDTECSSIKTGFICELWNVPLPYKEMSCRGLINKGYRFDSTSNLCVKFNFNQASSQSMAKDACRQDGASLVTIDNTLKTDYILTQIFIAHKNDTDLWVGLEDVYRNNTFYWPTQAPLGTYTHWGSSDVYFAHAQPDMMYGATNQRCVYMSYINNYFWYDEDCSALKTGFMCEIMSSDPSQKAQLCRQKLFDGFLYEATNDICVALTTGVNATRQQAESKCQEHNANLVVIDTSEKMDYILERIFIAKANDTDFWIGGYYSSGSFQWQPIHTSFTYTHWYDVNPIASSNCAYMNYQDNYFWHASSCNASGIRGYTCEINDRSLNNP